MKISSQLTDKQYRLLFMVMTLAILCFISSILFVIPEKYYSLYALFLSVVFLVDVLIFPRFQAGKISEDEEIGSILFLVMAFVLILSSLFLLYLGVQPGYWMLSYVFSAGFLTSMIIFQYLRNREIIP